MIEKIKAFFVKVKEFLIGFVKTTKFIGYCVDTICVLMVLTAAWLIPNNAFIGTLAIFGVLVFHEFTKSFIKDYFKSKNKSKVEKPYVNLEQPVDENNVEDNIENEEVAEEHKDGHIEETKEEVDKIEEKSNEPEVAESEETVTDKKDDETKSEIRGVVIDNEEEDIEGIKNIAKEEIIVDATYKVEPGGEHKMTFQEYHAKMSKTLDEVFADDVEKARREDAIAKKLEEKRKSKEVEPTKELNWKETMEEIETFYENMNDNLLDAYDGIEMYNKMKEYQNGSYVLTADMLDEIRTTQLAAHSTITKDMDEALDVHKMVADQLSKELAHMPKTEEELTHEHWMGKYDDLYDRWNTTKRIYNDMLQKINDYNIPRARYEFLPDDDGTISGAIEEYKNLFRKRPLAKEHAELLNEGLEALKQISDKMDEDLKPKIEQVLNMQENIIKAEDLMQKLDKSANLNHNLMEHNKMLMEKIGEPEKTKESLPENPLLRDPIKSVEFPLTQEYIDSLSDDEKKMLIKDPVRREEIEEGDFKIVIGKEISMEERKARNAEIDRKLKEQRQRLVDEENARRAAEFVNGGEYKPPVSELKDEDIFDLPWYEEPEKLDVFKHPELATDEEYMAAFPYVKEQNEDGLVFSNGDTLEYQEENQFSPVIRTTGDDENDKMLYRNYDPCVVPGVTTSEYEEVVRRVRTLVAVNTYIGGAYGVPNSDTRDANWGLYDNSLLRSAFAEEKRIYDELSKTLQGYERDIRKLNTIPTVIVSRPSQYQYGYYDYIFTYYPVSINGEKGPSVANTERGISLPKLMSIFDNDIREFIINMQELIISGQIEDTSINEPRHKDDIIRERDLNNRPPIPTFIGNPDEDEYADIETAFSREDTGYWFMD